VEELTIGEVARRAGLETSAVRYYESIGLLKSLRRVNGHRRYDASVLHILTMIRFAQQAGFTLAEIETLFHGFEPDTPPAARWRSMAQEKLPEIDLLIERAQGMKHMLENGLRCGCLRLEDCAIMIEGCQSEAQTDSQ
jgi:MerR family transcriptional regulator, redox-sensitive transcriptional activator SoxR